MRIGIGQINARTGAPHANARKMLQWVDEARAAGCSLVAFPELSLCGARPLDLLWDRGFLTACEETLEMITRASRGIAVVVGVPGRAEDARRLSTPRRSERSGRKLLTNRAVLLMDGRRVAWEDKQCLDVGSIPCEARYFLPGERTQVHTIGDRTWGILIGEDVRTDEGPLEEQCALGAEWVISLWASPFSLGRAQGDAAMMARRARESGIGLICVRLVGGQDDLVYDGGSAVYDATGQCIFQAPRFAEGLYVVDLASAGQVASHPMSPAEELRAALTMGIRDYTWKNGFSRLLVGLSGGVDSAVVAALAVDAVGPSNVRCVYLPSEFSSEESAEDARRTSQALGVSLEEIRIEQVHHALRSALPGTPSGLVDENLQPRARGTLLMALSNQAGELVLCPGNKSEIAMGYNTLYGDTVGALAPIADLYKEQVIALGRALGERIPERVLSKPPSAELRPNQRDEDDLPAYEVLDPLLREIIDGRADVEELLAKGYEEPLVRDVLKRLHTSEYKRRQLPPGIRVSAAMLGAGRVFPITHGERETADDPGSGPSAHPA